MREVARFTGPQSHIVRSSSFFPPVEIFYDMVSVLTRLSRKLLHLPNFLDCRSLIPFHHFTEHRSSVSRPSSSSGFHNLYFLFFLSPVPHSSVRLSTTQAPLYAVCLFLQGKTCSAVTAALTGEQTLILIRCLLAADKDAPWSIARLFSTHARMTRTRTDAHLVTIRVITCNNVQRNAGIYCRHPVRHKSFSHSWVSPWANASCQEAIKPNHTP